MYVGSKLFCKTTAAANSRTFLRETYWEYVFTSRFQLSLVFLFWSVSLPPSNAQRNSNQEHYLNVHSFFLLSLPACSFVFSGCWLFQLNRPDFSSIKSTNRIFAIKLQIRFLRSAVVSSCCQVELIAVDLIFFHSLLSITTTIIWAS